MTQTAVELWQELACPRDRSRLEPRGETLVCEQGHEYPFVDGIPVMVVDDEIAPTQPGYWSKPEQIERVRAEEPPPVEGEAVDPYVAELILGTHGNLYKHLSGGMPRYPIPDFPLPRGNGELLLDIGCNWGRWTIAAAQRGYRPIGIDPSFEAIVAARRIARQLGVDDARYVVADARKLPFADGTFDVVFSYGVLQHFSKSDVALSVARHPPRAPARRLLVGADAELARRAATSCGSRSGGSARATSSRCATGSRPSCKRVFGRIGPTELSTDGFFTLNPQKRDLDLLPPRFRALVRVSEGVEGAFTRRRRSPTA